MSKWLKLPDRPFHHVPTKAPRCEVRQVALLGKTATWRCKNHGECVFVVPLNEDQDKERRGLVLVIHVCSQHAAELGD